MTQHYEDYFPLPPDPVTVASDQVCQALVNLDRPAGAYLRFPWPALDALVGGIAPGWVWFLGGFSGNGKTTLLVSLLDLLYRLGKRVYYLGLETQPDELRTMWSCLRLGINPGDALTGEIQRAPNAAALTAALEADLKAQVINEDRARRVYISPEEFIDGAKLATAVDEAAEFRADVFVVDHIDHVLGSGTGSLYTESVQNVRRVLSLAKQYRMTMLVATQFNNEAATGHPLAVYMPPQPQHVYMGGHKRQIAAGMLGLYRPLRMAGVEKEEMAAIHAGGMEAWKVLEPNTMGVVVMKHRHYGSRERHSCLLRVEQGRCVDFPARDAEAFQHGIRTTNMFGGAA